jgi:dynein light chain LC8-type
MAEKIEICEMIDDMRDDAIREAGNAAEHKDSEKEISKAVKKYFDNKYQPCWNCVVGKSFNAYVSYQAKHFIFFYVKQIAVLLYKMG